jgi:hypothetical protein
MTADTIARLKITLNDVEPLVLRRIEIPFDIRLDRLHEVLQAAMGWSNSHLYEICAGGVGWGLTDPDLARRSTRCTQGKARPRCRRHRRKDSALSLRLR